MPTGTTYNPPNIMSFVKTALQFASKGISATITAGAVQTVDLLITDDSLITGLEIIVNDGNYGDNVTLQVIDTTGFTGAPPGTVLLQPVLTWYTAPSYQDQYDIVYPAKIIAGLTLRVVYTSTGSNNVFLGINYKLHKVMT